MLWSNNHFWFDIFKIILKLLKVCFYFARLYQNYNIIDKILDMKMVFIKYVIFEFEYRINIANLINTAVEFIIDFRTPFIWISKDDFKNIDKLFFVIPIWLTWKTYLNPIW